MRLRQFNFAWRIGCVLVCLFAAGGPRAQIAAAAAKQQPTHKSGKAAHAKDAPLVVEPEQPAPQQVIVAPTPPPPPPPDPLGRETPYGTVFGFLQAVNNHNLQNAALYLDVKLPEHKEEELAEQLKAVLDASLASGIDRLSKDQQGNIKDNLRMTREKIGVVKTPSGEFDILLDRIDRQNAVSIWLFSGETLARIPSAYASLNRFDLSHYLPESFRKVEFFGLPLWRWLMIAVSISLALLLSRLVARLVLLVFRLFLHHGHVENEKDIIRRLERPVRVLLLAIVIVAMTNFSLSVLARHYWTMGGEVIAAIGLVWLMVCAADLAAEAATRRSIATGVQEKIAIITLAQRLFKIVALFALVLILLRQAGVNVSAMLAGLGIGGIALALAAQNTLADLFGGITIISRETIRVGDYCRVGDQTGTIEDIGLSSTRLRTLDRTVVSIPNSKIAQMSSENFTLRDVFWFHQFLTLRMETPQPQIEQVLAVVLATMKQSPEVVADGSARVNLIEIQGGSYRLELFAYLRAANINVFLGRQQELLLSVLTAVTEMGVRLAFPSQTMYMETPESSLPAQSAVAEIHRKVG
jgi:MscS family membrane protein